MNIKDLNTIFKHVLPVERASQWTRSWKAISSVRQDRKVKLLADRIWADVQALVYHHASHAATAVQVDTLTSTVTSLSMIPAGKKTHFMVRYEKG